MLGNIQIENFRCLKFVSGDLKPLTVLIGPNDSGKSTFLTAIRRLTEPQIGFDDSDHWLGDSKNQIAISGLLPGNPARTCSVQSGDSARLSNRKGSARQQLKPCAYFQLLSTGPHLVCRPYSEEELTDLPLNSDGELLAALLDILRRERKRFCALVDALKNLMPGLNNINIETPHSSRRKVNFVIENGFHVPANLASVGARMLLFFTALTYHPRPPRTILIEEPEKGLHPKRLGQVVQLLRDLTKGKFGDHPAQVIVTTHSPYLLDFVNLPHDQVLVFRRNGDGSSTAQPADTDRLSAFLDEFMLGEVWFNEEEAGLVAKP